MPNQILPITDLAKAGVIMDTPAVTLPPNVFSNVQNVRFRDGAIRKLPGEESIFTTITPNLAYVAYWEGPFNTFYVVVETDGNIILYDTNFVRLGVARGNQDITNAVFQHTLFNGGFNFILNDGISTPVYLTDADLTVPGATIPLASPLPNWNSYLAQENVVSVVWDFANADIPLGRSVSLDLVTGTTVDTVGEQTILFRIIPRDPSLPVLTQSISQLVRLDNTGTYSVPGNSLFSVQDPTSDNWLIIPTDRDTTVTPITPGAEPGDTIEIAIQERPDIEVTAGVVRAYGSLLVAGNLREVSGNTIIRALPGTVRTSDVAPPGNVPANWNPFRNGANTADEFTLSSTGTVQDMMELQGNLYIYTTNSIHSLQQTGGNIPFGIRPVTDSYGANNLGSVFEVDGKHIVVGSNDVYVFAGHPGSIQSIADSRVRHQTFFDRDDIRILRYSRYDELWFYSPNEQEMFIWNYRDNTWTRRMQTIPLVGNLGPDGLIFINQNATDIYTVDSDLYRTVGNAATHESYVERIKLAITPEFTTETLVSVGMLTEGNVQFLVEAEGSNRPSARVMPSDDMNPTPFNSVTDATMDGSYKADIRTHGRLLNYRITDNGNAVDTEGWRIAGLQFDIGTGGTR